MQVLVLILSVLELVGIASVFPFMAVVSNPMIIFSNPILNHIYHSLGFSDSQNFMMFLGAAVFFSALVSNCVGLFANHAVIKFGFQLGRNVATNLFRRLLGKDYIFHIYNNSSILTNKVIKQVDRAVMGVVIPYLQFNSRLFIVLFISIGLILVNPFLSLVIGGILSAAYVVIFFLTRKVLERNGVRITHAARETFKIINEGFSGIKEVKFLGKEDRYVLDYDKNAHEYALAATVNQFVPIVPRYLIEVLAFGGIVLSIILFLSKGKSLNEFLPMLSIFAAAGLKLMPALQQVFAALATLKGSIDALEDIMEDYDELPVERVLPLNYQPTKFEKKISLNNIVFNYPSNVDSVLKGITLTIEKNSSVALVGSSGAGKTTLVDVLLGLIQVDSGEIQVDGIDIIKNNLRSWQDLIGYVPQTIFLSDSTIRENIAFGVKPNLIDDQKIKYALRMSHLEKFINELPNGVYTKVGERGVQLSGGQRQRIGIARALYEDPPILIFDEATSALDNITENSVMNEIKEFSGKKTIIIIAHRLSTIRNCDKIFVLNHGQITTTGTYDELRKKVDIFQVSES